MVGKVFEKRLLISGKAKEEILFTDPLRRRRWMQRALAVDEILLLLEGLAANAVPALVDAFVNVAGVVNSLGQGRHAGLMPGLRGADEIVERQVEALPGSTELLFHLIAVRQRIQRFLGRLFEDVLRVFVV